VEHAASLSKATALDVVKMRKQNGVKSALAVLTTITTHAQNAKQTPMIARNLIIFSANYLH